MPANIVPHQVWQGAEKVTCELTILAGPSPHQLKEVKRVSQAGLLGSVAIDLPENSRWLGLMVRQADRKIVRWARPIKISGAVAPKVKMNECLAQSENLTILIESHAKAGPFGVEDSLRLELASRQKAASTIHLMPLSWKPGDPLFASAWLKGGMRASASLAVGFFGASDNFLGAVDLLKRRYSLSPLYQRSLLPDVWEYVSTTVDQPIPPLAHRAVLIVKTKYYPASSPSRRFLEFADLRVRTVALVGLAPGIRRVGRVPGSMYYLSASDDDQRIILAGKSGGLWVFDAKLRTSRKVSMVKEKTRVLWARLNDETLYYLDNKRQFRGVDIKIGKVIMHSSLLGVNDYYPKISLSPNGQWLAVGDGDGKITMYRLQKGGVEKMKPMSMPVPVGGSDRPFYAKYFDFNKESNLTIQTSDHYWQWSVENQSIKPLGQPIKREDKAPFGAQGMLYFDRPLSVSFRWLDPLHQKQLWVERSNKRQTRVSYYSGDKERTLTLPHQLSNTPAAFTVLPKSGEFLYVDSLGVLWQVASPLP